MIIDIPDICMGRHELSENQSMPAHTAVHSSTSISIVAHACSRVASLFVSTCIHAHAPDLRASSRNYNPHLCRINWWVVTLRIKNESSAFRRSAIVLSTEGLILTTCTAQVVNCSSNSTLLSQKSVVVESSVKPAGWLSECRPSAQLVTAGRRQAARRSHRQQARQSCSNQSDYFNFNYWCNL